MATAFYADFRIRKRTSQPAVMAARRVWIGVDGGGTKTALSVLTVRHLEVLHMCSPSRTPPLQADSDTPIATHVGESTNHNSVGLEKARHELQSVLQEVLKKAHATPADGAPIITPRAEPLQCRASAWAWPVSIGPLIRSVCRVGFTR